MGAEKSPSGYDDGDDGMEQTEDLDEFLIRNFEGIQLKKPLFYNSPNAIRFEMGGVVDIPQERAEQVRERAFALFNMLNNPDDCIYFVLFMDVWENEEIETIKGEVGKVFEIYMPELDFKSVLIENVEFRYGDLDDFEEKIETMRFSSIMQFQQLKLESLVEAIANRTLGLEPNVVGDIYIINTSNKAIFHLYDDRGMDIVAENKETLRKVYVQCNSWILDYDRIRIDAMFL